MTYSAQAVTVLIASPGDVVHWREMVEQTINRWNRSVLARQTRVVAIPYLWETDVVPIMGTDGQMIVNHQIADSVDVVIALFHSRLGQPTARAASGTAEEIERARNRGVRVHVLIDKSPIANDADLDQMRALREYTAQLSAQGVLGPFRTEDDLRRIVLAALDKDTSELATTPEQEVTDTAGAAEGSKAAFMGRVLGSDRELLVRINKLLPLESPALVWLREDVGSAYHRSQAKPLQDFVGEIQRFKRHLHDQYFDAALQDAVDCMDNFLRYLNTVSFAEHKQRDDNDPLVRIHGHDHDGKERLEIQPRLGRLADQADSAYREFWRNIESTGWTRE